jgi:alpha-amylase/alpha-mannosidase (GH57 family)
MTLCQDEELKLKWLYLQTSDHFYYMCTKFFSDGDVHMYFNHYDSPYEAYINYMNVLSDFKIELEKHLKSLAQKTKSSNSSAKKITTKPQQRTIKSK